MGMFEGNMRIPFQILNCPSHHLPGMTNMNGHRILYKSSLHRNLAVQSSSVLLQTDESGNPPESKKSSASRTESKKSSASRTALTSSSSSGSLLSQVNTVGIIGGASAVSTLSFLEKLIKWSSEDGEDSLPFIACCDPVLSKELLSLERSSFPYLNSKKVRSQLDPTPVVENLKHKRIFLEESGARCIVMPCHISHAWHGEISKGCSVPFLHVGDCVTKELKKAKLKPLEAGGNLRIGVLAADATLTAGIYQEKLQNQGFEVVLPDKATMEHTVIPSIEALRRKDIEGARNLLRIALQVLLVRAVNKIILASDNMQGLLPRDDPLLKKCIDPMDALARSTIMWAQSTEKVYQSTKMQL